MKKHFLLVLAIFCSLHLYAQEKHALIIAIGDYPEMVTGWKKISSANDVGIIKETLLKHGFKQENIKDIQDQEADYEGIQNAFESLIENPNVKKGDIVFIHISAHGQPIYDKKDRDGKGYDEIDGYDEAIVPINAYGKYNEKMANGDLYTGQYHLRDDELGQYVTRLRNKLKSNGQVVLLLDTCHSGTATRGPLDGITRGSFVPLEPDGYQPPKSKEKEIYVIDDKAVNENSSPYVVISGAEAQQINNEYDEAEKSYGSLSYAFYSIMDQLPRDVTYNQLYAKIASRMARWKKVHNNPTIEGAGNLLLFKNLYSSQEPFYPVKSIINGNKKLVMQGGKIHSLNPGTTVIVCKVGSTSVEAAIGPKHKGKIIESKSNEATIELEKSLGSNRPQDFVVFVDQIAFEDINMKVFIDSSIKDEELISEVKKFLKEKNLGEVVNKPSKAEIGIKEMRNGKYDLYTSDELKGLFGKRGELLAKGNGPDGWDELKVKLFNYARGINVANIEMKDEAYKFEMKLVPVKINADDKGNYLGFEPLGPDDSLLNENGQYKVKATTSQQKNTGQYQDAFFLQIRHVGDKPFYITVVEINDKGEITSYLPSCQGSAVLPPDEERKLSKGQTEDFSTYVYPRPVGLPNGMESEKIILKAFATPQRMDVSAIVMRKENEVLSCFEKVGQASSVQKYLESTKDTNRDSSKYVQPKEKLEGYSTELIFEIIK